MRTSPVLATAPLLAAALLACSTAEAPAQQSWRTVTLSRQLSGEEAVAVSVRYGAGELRVRSTGDGPLYRMHLRYDEESFSPVAQYEPGRLRLGVEGLGRRTTLGRDRGGGDMQLELAGGVPMELELDLGAVKAEMDLGGLALTSLQLRTGASATRVDVSTPNSSRLARARLDVGAADFTVLRLGNLGAADVSVSAGVGKVRLELTGEWQRDANVSVQMGLGSLELVVPDGLGVRLNRQTFLTSLEAGGLERRGDAYYSPGWDSAVRRVTVDVNAAFGSIRILSAG